MAPVGTIFDLDAFDDSSIKNVYNCQRIYTIVSYSVYVIYSLRLPLSYSFEHEPKITKIVQIIKIFFIYFVLNFFLAASTYLHIIHLFLIKICDYLFLQFLLYLKLVLYRNLQQ